GSRSTAAVLRNHWRRSCRDPGSTTSHVHSPIARPRRSHPGRALFPRASRASNGRDEAVGSRSSGGLSQPSGLIFRTSARPRKTSVAAPLYAGNLTEKLARLVFRHRSGVVAMGSFSLMHWIVVLAIILILFGAGKLPRVMGDFAKGVKAFKAGMKEEDEAETTPQAQVPPPGAAASTAAPAAAADRPREHAKTA